MEYGRSHVTKSAVAYNLHRSAVGALCVDYYELYEIERVRSIGRTVLIHGVIGIAVVGSEQDVVILSDCSLVMLSVLLTLLLCGRRLADFAYYSFPRAISSNASTISAICSPTKSSSFVSQNASLIAPPMKSVRRL